MNRLLVLAETDGSAILPATLAAIDFAQKYSALTGEPFDLLLIGDHKVGGDGDAWSAFGADRVIIAADTSLAHPTADQVTSICVIAMEFSGADSLAAASTTFSRDVLPRTAGLLSIPMVSDVLSINEAADGSVLYKRPMYAGNLIATVEVDGGCIFSVRTTGFSKPPTSATQSEVRSLSTSDCPPPLAEWISIDGAKQSRPELTTARVVVSGGRPLKDSETFERVIGGLADKLGGAVGATRAAVDAGIVPNELQIGQTGKVVAPDLYIAAGISGSIQHLAGMKESKVIVAINTDPDAPIFQAADYGLVADLFQAVPELTDSL